MSFRDAHLTWQRHVAALSQQGHLDVDVRVAIAGSFTLEPLVPFLGSHLLSKRFNPQIVVGPFNQLPQICRNHSSILGTNALDAIVLMWRMEDIFRDVLGHCLFEKNALAELLGQMEHLVEAVAHLRRTFAGTLIVSAPPYPTLTGFDLLDTDHAAAGMATFHAASQFWIDAIARLDRVRLLDLHGAVLNSGRTHAHDARKWLLYRQPYTDAFLRELGSTIGRLIASERRAAKKCIVLDLDNTLWGGVVGEDGLAGIQLSDEFPGKAYRDFQECLLHLKRKGVLLAVASKNNPDDAYEVFDKHDAMVLSRADVAAFEIHWDSKVESIRRIAARLNIGLDSLVFIDDSAKEIAEVTARLPEVTCVIVPEELAQLPGLLSDTDYFDTAGVTQEDVKRTEMLAAERLRQGAQDSMSEEEFRYGLNLTITIFPVKQQHVARVAQLINKTNQFNLTTIRRTADEVQSLLRSDDVRVLAMDVCDRYGEYGLVGVAIMKKVQRSCVIDTFLMSCRVLGRGAEAALIRNIVDTARALGCTELRGRYVPTAKNGLVRDLYKQLQFTYHAACDEWVYAEAENRESVPVLRANDAGR